MSLRTAVDHNELLSIGAPRAIEYRSLHSCAVVGIKCARHFVKRDNQKKE